jgi:phosphoribosylanthranilate isomerase
LTKIKICGLSRLCDIDAVNDARPDYIGFVFAESKRQVTPETACKLRERLHSGIMPVGVFVNEEISNIAFLAAEGIISAVQLHGDEDEDYIIKVKTLTGVPVIKAAPVVNKGDAQKWQNTGADYLLLDNKSGGGGKPFDWDLIGRIDKPFFLAGGLNIDNIDLAINTVRPFAADISSGVEAEGFKDYEKIQDIVRRIRNE